VTYWLKIVDIFYRTLNLMPLLGVNPFEFLDEHFITKTTVLGLSTSGDFVILACVVFETVTDRQTDGQTTRP